MKVQNLGRSKQSAKDFFQSVDEPVEAIVNGQSFIVWPTEALEFMARVLTDKGVQDGLKRAHEDVRQGNFVEFDPDAPTRPAKKTLASRKRAKP